MKLSIPVLLVDMNPGPWQIDPQTLCFFKGSLLQLMFLENHASDVMGFGAISTQSLAVINACQPFTEEIVVVPCTRLKSQWCCHTVEQRSLLLRLTIYMPGWKLYMLTAWFCSKARRYECPRSRSQEVKIWCGWKGQSGTHLTPLVSHSMS